MSLLNPLAAFTRGVSYPNRAKRGIYAGRGILSGNNVSKHGVKYESISDYFSSIEISNYTCSNFLNTLIFICNIFRTKRKWYPNVFKKRLYSESLNKVVNVKCTAHALRCIDKAGGLDNYMLSVYKPEEGALINKLRKEILKEIKRKEWAEANPEEALAFDEKMKEKQEAEETAEAEMRKREYLRNFTFISATESNPTQRGTPWKRNWGLEKPKLVKSNRRGKSAFEQVKYGKRRTMSHPINERKFI